MNDKFKAEEDLEYNHKIILVSHCILNSNSAIHGRTCNHRLAREIINTALTNNISIIQLPCPEITLLGAKRWAQSFEQYDTTAFAKHCKKIIEPIVDQIVDHSNDNVKLVAAIGIAGSPSCGIYEVSSAPYSGLIPGMTGAEALPEATAIPRQGHFIQILQKQLRLAGIHFKLLELPKKGCNTDKRRQFTTHFKELME